MSLLSGYKKKTSYDGYECLQLVDSGGDSFNFGGRGSNSHTLGSSLAASLGPKGSPLQEHDCSTMDSSGKTKRQLAHNLVPRRSPLTKESLERDAANKRYWGERGRDFHLHGFSLFIYGV